MYVLLQMYCSTYRGYWLQASHSAASLRIDPQLKEMKSLVSAVIQYMYVVESQILNILYNQKYSII